MKPAGAYQCRINFCQEDSRYLFKITILREVLFFLLKKLSSTFKWQVKLKAVSPQCSLVSAAGISSLLQLFPPYVCWCRLLPLGFRLRHLCGLGSKDGELCPRGKMLAARTVTTRVHLWQRREAEVALARRALLLGFLKTDRQWLLPSPHTQICLHTRVHTRVHIAHRTMPKETVPHQQN